MNPLKIPTPPLKPIPIRLMQHRIRGFKIRIRRAKNRLDQVIEAMLQMHDVLVRYRVYKRARDATVLQHREGVFGFEVLQLEHVLWG